MHLAEHLPACSHRPRVAGEVRAAVDAALREQIPAALSAVMGGASQIPKVHTPPGVSWIALPWRDGASEPRVHEVLEAVATVTLPDGSQWAIPPVEYRRELSLTGAVAAALGGADAVMLLVGSRAARLVRDVEVGSHMAEARSVLGVALGCYDLNSARGRLVDVSAEGKLVRGERELHEHSATFRAWLATEGIGLARSALTVV